MKSVSKKVVAVVELTMPQAEILLAADCFTKSNLASALSRLIVAAPLPGLDGHPECHVTANRIIDLLGVHPSLRGTTSEAGLWLLAGDLDKSHAVSQSIETPIGSYWHGIMHRREGDFWNANYWFRRVGKHPVHSEFAARLVQEKAKFSSILSRPELYQATTVAETVTDGCQKALSKNGHEVEAWQAICWLEWQLLFLHDML
jgi:hypothetical protein